MQTKSRTEKALVCLAFLFRLRKSEINWLVLVIFKFYHRRCISSSNFAFHVCFSFFLLLLRFLQDEVQKFPVKLQVLPKWWSCAWSTPDDLGNGLYPPKGTQSSSTAYKWYCTSKR